MVELRRSGRLMQSGWKRESKPRQEQRRQPRLT